MDGSTTPTDRPHARARGAASGVARLCARASGVLGCAMAVGCAGPSADALNRTMVDAPFTLTAPGPGRVPVRIESSGAAEQIGWPSGRDRVRVEVAPRNRRIEHVEPGGQEACTTPCTVYLAPGVWNLWSGGADVRAAVWSLEVPREGAHVRIHAPSPWGYDNGPWLMLASSVILAPGVLLYVGGSHDTGVVAASAIVLGAGALVFTAGALLWLVNAATGVESSEPLDASDRDYSAGTNRLTVVPPTPSNP